MIKREKQKDRMYDRKRNRRTECMIEKQKNRMYDRESNRRIEFMKERETEGQNV